MAAPREEQLICDKFNLEALTVNSLSHATLMASTLDQFKSLAQSHYY
jgi:hypothetical protein